MGDRVSDQPLTDEEIATVRRFLPVAEAAFDGYNRMVAERHSLLAERDEARRERDLALQNALHPHPGCGCTTDPDRPEPLWADVLLHPETHTPTLLTQEQRNEVNEALSDILAGEWLERCWIQAGPLDREAPPG